MLIVDDDDAVRELLTEGLLEAGCDVDQATDGQVAWQKLSQHHYDAVILDVKMPGISGPELYERMGQRSPEMARRVIFITGDTVSPDTVEFLQSMDAPRLAKPFVLEELVAAVRTVAQRATAP